MLAEKSLSIGRDRLLAHCVGQLFGQSSRRKLLDSQAVIGINRHAKAADCCGLSDRNQAIRWLSVGPSITVLWEGILAKLARMHYQFFALDAGNNIRSVDDVANGAACGCHCSECDGDLQSKQGEIRRWHFAHTNDSGCSGGAETALHLAAKQMLLHSSSIMVPQISLCRTVTLPDGRQGRGIAVRPAGHLEYNGGQEEVPIGDVQPDVVVKTVYGPVIIEITVSHGVDREKHGKLLKLGMPALEVTLHLARSLKRDPGTHVDAWNELRQALIESVQGKNWLVNLEQARLSEEAIEAAQRDVISFSSGPSAAMAQPVPPNMTNYSLAIGRDRVSVRTLPFGIALRVDVVGDVAVDPKLISLIKHFGSSWNKKYRNWICPREKQEEIYLALHRLSRLIDEEAYGERHQRVLAAYNSQRDSVRERQTLSTVFVPEPEPEQPPEPEEELGSACGINQRIRARIAADKAKRKD